MYTRKRKECIARGTYRSKYKKRDVAGKFNILTKSGADSSSRLLFSLGVPDCRALICSELTTLVSRANYKLADM